MTGPVLSLREMSTDLKNTDFLFKTLVKPLDFVVKHYINIYMTIVIFFFFKDSQYLRLYLYSRSETRVILL